MLLALDAGNTNITIGAFDGDILKTSFRVSSKSNATSDEMSRFIESLLAFYKLNKKDVKDVIISTVVPDIISTLNNAINKSFCIFPTIVHYKMDTGIKIEQEYPEKLGADRLVNAAAAYHCYGGPVVVIDYGTATTFDFVSQYGEFLTGLICPGIRTCADALYKNLALSKNVEFKVPDCVLPRNNFESVQAGLFYSHIGEAKYIIEKYKEHFQNPFIKVVATGGLSSAIGSVENIFDVIDENLTLKGLKLIFDKNKKSVHRHSSPVVKMRAYA